jgi:aspartate aminotransferase
VLEALSGPQEQVTEMADEFRKRRDCIVGKLNEIPGISCLKPKGAFYAFANVSEVLKKGALEGSVSFAEKLLAEANVAVVPGSAFGDDRYIRLSYATSMDNIKKGMERIKRFVEKIL